jgi:hypothetical protein
LLEQLKTHAKTCLEPGKCSDPYTGGLRLSSTTPNTWPSKVALTLAAMGWLEGRSPKEIAPKACEQLRVWMQSSAKSATVSDQINASNGKLIGGSYYPRLVTVQVLLQALGGR